MLQSMRSRRMVASVGVILGLSVTVTAVAAAQSPCPEEVIGYVTEPYHTHEGQLIGWRSESRTTQSEKSGELGVEAGRGAGAPSGSGALGGKTSTGTTVTYNVGTYQFDNGQRYEVNCSNMQVGRQLPSEPLPPGQKDPYHRSDP